MSEETSRPPEPTIDGQPLATAGFSNAGVQRFQKTVVEYTKELFRRALANGRASQGENLPLEVTQEHVHSAAASLSGPLVAPSSRSPWYVVGHTLEYVGFAIAGLGGGKLDEPWGIYAFGLGLAAGVILVVVRLTISERRR